MDAQHALPPAYAFLSTRSHPAWVAGVPGCWRLLGFRLSCLPGDSNLFYLLCLLFACTPLAYAHSRATCLTAYALLLPDGSSAASSYILPLYICADGVLSLPRAHVRGRRCLDYLSALPCLRRLADFISAVSCCAALRSVSGLAVRFPAARRCTWLHALAAARGAGGTMLLRRIRVRRGTYLPAAYSAGFRKLLPWGDEMTFRLLFRLAAAYTLACTSGMRPVTALLLQTTRLYTLAVAPCAGSAYTTGSACLDCAISSHRRVRADYRATGREHSG